MRFGHCQTLNFVCSNWFYERTKLENQIGELENQFGSLIKPIGTNKIQSLTMTKAHF